MTERMTQARAETLAATHPRDLTFDERAALQREALRARAEEARLLEVVTKQEERIQALEKALRGMGYVARGEWHTEMCHEFGEHGKQCADAVAVLGSLAEVSP